MTSIGPVEAEMRARAREVRQKFFARPDNDNARADRTVKVDRREAREFWSIPAKRRDIDKLRRKYETERYLRRIEDKPAPKVRTRTVVPAPSPKFVLIWNDTEDADRIRIITELNAEGYSCGMIARHFKDITRGGIIGFCDRRNIKLKARPDIRNETSVVFK